MRQFKELERFQLQRGTVIMVALDRDEEKAGLHTRLQAEGVTIDGTPVKVRDVESWALATLRKGTAIGLLIEQEPNK